MLYHVGDKINCRVSEDYSVIFDADFDDPRYQKFSTVAYEVIGFRNNCLYVILVASFIDSSFMLTEELIKDNHIDPKYLGSWAFYVREEAVSGRIIVDYYKNALKCFCCREYSPYAESNQDNGRFVCWSCRQDVRSQLIHNLK